MDPAEYVRRLAALANLELTEEEVVRFAADLPAVMEHMAVLKAAPSSPAEPIAAEGQEDEPLPPLPQEVVLGLAPRTDGAHVIADLPRGR